MFHFVGGILAISINRQRARDALQRIAKSLQCPVETLMQWADNEDFPDETAELVRLWFKIEDPAARRIILAQVRKAAIDWK